MTDEVADESPPIALAERTERLRMCTVLYEYRYSTSGVIQCYGTVPVYQPGFRIKHLAGEGGQQCLRLCQQGGLPSSFVNELANCWPTQSANFSTVQYS